MKHRALSFNLIPTLTAGLITGLLEILFAISFAALIFVGDLQPYVGSGVGIALFSGLISSAIIALFSSIRGTVGGNQDATAAIIAVAAVTMGQQLSTRGIPPADIFITVVLLIGLTTFLAGLSFLALGYFKLGRFVRFLPYPVIGGFLAGTGWLLTSGAAGFMADTAQFATLLQPARLSQWLPGALLGVVLLLAARRSTNPFTLPGLIIGSALLFHLIGWLTGSSLSSLVESGWLLAPFPQQNLFQPFVLADLSGVRWLALRGQLPSILTILLVSAFALLLNVNGAAIATQAEADLNRDLRAGGLNNVVAGLFGGFIGFHQLSLTVFNHRIGANNRLTGLVATLICSLTLLLGASLLSLIPKFVLGGLLFYLGLEFLAEWVFEAWATFPKRDYGVILIILVAIAVFGFLQGVAVGMLVAILLFVLNYSQINVIRHALTGKTYESRVLRPRLYDRLLRQRGDALSILQLQGFIFFGTAQQLVEHVQAQIEHPDSPRLRYLLLDFRLVTGIDSSATFSIAKLVQLIKGKGIELVFTSLPETASMRWQQKVFADEAPPNWHRFPSLEEGVVWCEEQIIAQFASVGLMARPKTVVEQLDKLLDGKERSYTDWGEALRPPRRSSRSPQMETLYRYLLPLEVAAGEVVVAAGEETAGFYFIEAGRVHVTHLDGQGKATVVRVVEKGNVVGETAVYTNHTTSTQLVAAEATSLLFLSTEKLAQLEQDAPEIAIVLHRLIAAMLSEKLEQASQLIQMLAP